MRLRRIFDTVDENGDGKMMIEEISLFLKKLRMQMSDKDVESIICPLETARELKTMS